MQKGMSSKCYIYFTKYIKVNVYQWFYYLLCEIRAFLKFVCFWKQKSDNPQDKESFQNQMVSRCLGKEIFILSKMNFYDINSNYTHTTFDHV